MGRGGRSVKRILIWETAGVVTAEIESRGDMWEMVNATEESLLLVRAGFVFFLLTQPIFVVSFVSNNCQLWFTGLDQVRYDDDEEQDNNDYDDGDEGR